MREIDRDKMRSGERKEIEGKSNNSILDRGYGKPRQLKPEPISTAAKAELDAEAAAKAHAEFMQLPDEMLLDFTDKETEEQRPSERSAGADPLPQWTIGWEG
ncbi:hypothetical protein [Microvirga makkahensis]|uniref:Uncharacterized protein n=1 Tax=Microvirga makkahensis TaxID=1128670 RepID=A0A7X3SQV4_9HYPH|nr:hypothetical protein [Microvirga makkahensis]MXQ13956.1 hypothetical protein [Microvirga makkahensis]